ncbi:MULTISPECIES: hypothetical protein [unclassified Brenneria]|uniref:hypothetical protein n=1 Tax=unclassified Brenneria TaxID=2634434 RepID=UPI00155655DD|nr:MULTISPECIES: hypothetical protein [unclassified Brenneria]MBJ7222171.1 hypothetical protein [Brenneria sp. L3-3C-1]MEE3643414.1 hypothetical protein [Brenneria sp. L3_3C_1]MEE3651598.1 hypothetical protein [Brenneria sp. HEZEL_4_2_4]NPD01555.1 hypothetical protein [Brenneria sp. hezel4-2-4]
MMKINRGGIPPSPTKNIAVALCSHFLCQTVYTAETSSFCLLSAIAVIFNAAATVQQGNIQAESR